MRISFGFASIYVLRLKCKLSRSRQLGLTSSHPMSRSSTPTRNTVSSAAPAVTTPNLRRSGPMSVGRVLGVINQLAGGPHSLASLAKELGTPKPSLMGLLSELMQLGFIRKDQEGRYLLAGASFRLAARVSAAGSLNQSIRATLVGLSTDLEAAVSVAYLDPESRTMVYADRYGENSAVQYMVKFGTAIQLHTRATSKLLIAFEDESTWGSWFGPEPYKKLATRTHVKFATLKKELITIRNEGIAWTHSEQYDGISGCSVRVLDANDKVIAGVGLLMISEALEMNRKKVVSALREAADTTTAEFKMRGVTRANLSAYL